MRSYKVNTQPPRLLAILLFFFSFPVLASVPESSDSSHEEAGSEASLKDFRVSPYKKIRPEWGIEFSTSPNAFGANALTVEQGTQPIWAFSLLGEYQPAFLQDIGVIGIGPAFNIYPAIGGTKFTPNFASLVGLGGQIRYQARYFREQPVVPVVAYSLEEFKYVFDTGMSGWTLIHGPTVGLWVLLNFLESNSASYMYINNGVTRTYLIAEYRMMTGEDSNLTIHGGSYYFGLRFEF